MFSFLRGNESKDIIVPTIIAECCDHPFEKNISFVRSTVKEVSPKNTNGETIVILLDKSRSMDDVMEEMRKKTKSWIEQLQKRDPKPRIILAAFNEKGEILGDTLFNKNISYDKLKAKYSTNIESGLNVVVDQLRKKKLDPTNTTVFLLTDGEDNFIKSQDKAKEVFEGIKKKVGPVRFVPLGYGSSYNETILEILGDQCDCTHTYLKDADTFSNFTEKLSQEPKCGLTP